MAVSEDTIVALSRVASTPVRMVSLTTASTGFNNGTHQARHPLDHVLDNAFCPHLQILAPKVLLNNTAGF